MKIGVMGGTFDPIHNGHLIISEYIRDFLELDEVVFIPAGQPPHKNKDNVTPSNHRYIMTKLAIKDNPKFQVSDMEIASSKPSYTYHTIKKLKANNVYNDYYFIIGADSLFSLESWYKFNELTKLVNFALWERRGYYRDDIIDRIKYLKNKYGTNIHYIEGPIIEISSSQIRNRLESKRSIRYFLPKDVMEYIIKNDIYTGE